MITKDEFAQGLIGVLKHDFPCDYCPEYRFQKLKGVKSPCCNLHLFCDPVRNSVCEEYLGMEFYNRGSKTCPCVAIGDEAIEIAQRWLENNGYI